ncbi:MAG: hypothetical protein WC322_02220 [Candidatus Paceibacterota bacterium]|jgi:hypothetical protein
MQQADLAEMRNEIQKLRDMVMDLEREKAKYYKALVNITCLCSEGVEFSSASQIVQVCYKEAMQALKGEE